jgi:hsp70-interacting protein
MSSGSTNADPWAWLGLLRWTLSYHDGTKPSDLSPMSEEDKAFLEMVMKEGIIDENERMKFILQEFSKSMQYYQSMAKTATVVETTAPTQQDPPPIPPLSDDALEDLLQELRDIVEQVDYARAFVSLQGPTFLLGAITETSSGIPEVIRSKCLGILSTLAQNNPPVQERLLEIGAIKALGDLFLQQNGDQGKCSMMIKIAIVQATSAMVRGYDVTEAVFEQLSQAPLLLVTGLDPDPLVTNEKLRVKTLFFLNAFLTSDTSSASRCHKFVDPINMVADPQYLGGNSSAQLRELSIGILQQLLERRLAVNILLQRKDILASLGVQRISQMRSLTGEEAGMVQIELEQWESFLVLLARSKPEEEVAPAASVSGAPKLIQM